MLNSGRPVGVTLPEGQGQERIQETNKVLALGKPLQLRPLQYSDEYGRVHATVVFVAEDEMYLDMSTEQSVAKWRPLSESMKKQVAAHLDGESFETPEKDAVDIVGDAMAGGAGGNEGPVDIVGGAPAGGTENNEDPQATQ
jgi:hypothetical protein